MIDNLRRFLPLALIVVLLAACGPTVTANDTGGNGNKHVASTATPTTKPNTTSAPIDSCPGDLRTVPGCYSPHQFQVAYGVESLLRKGYTGKGQTVIDLVSFGSPTLKEDMDVYDKTFGLPPVDLEVISPLNVPEYDPRHDKGGWAGETTLDVQIIHSIAPDAKIIVLVSPVAETEGTIGLPEFRQLEQYAIDHKLGNIVSQSWGASELTLQDAAGQQELQKWNDLLKKATTEQGMTYFSSSGDEGATDYADINATKIANVPTTSFAADSPWITSVGGTSIINSASGYVERAWRGSGGGFSRFWQEPDYQKTLSTAAQDQLKNRRGVPDVSAAADPYTGLAMYQSGSWGVAGGTSAAAPLWAGLMAIANQMAGHPLGFINPALYKLGNSNTYAQDFHDVVVGNNNYGQVQGYPAIKGWDPVTGLGSPNAEKLIPDLISAINSQ